VRQLDIAGAPRGTVDAEIIYPDGRTAALEFTSVESKDVHHIRKRVSEYLPEPAPGKLTWSIHPESVADLDRLRSIYQHVILTVEGHGVNRPDELPMQALLADEDLKWIAWESKSAMAGYPSKSPPQVVWLNPIVSAIYGSEGEEITAGVAQGLRVEPAKGHLEKLLRDPHDERHLYLNVGVTGLGTSAAFALMNPSTLPSADPDMPQGVDHLWLDSGWGPTATVWSRGQGWRNVSVRGPWSTSSSVSSGTGRAQPSSAGGR
jgi:hypothetical protein